MDDSKPTVGRAFLNTHQTFIIKCSIAFSADRTLVGALTVVDTKTATHRQALDVEQTHFVPRTRQLFTSIDD